jgi:ABC-2 type transport system ATP-binding protein
VGGEDIVEFAVCAAKDLEPAASGENSCPPTLSTGKSRQDGARSGSASAETERAPVDAKVMTAIPGVQSHRVDAGVHQLSVSELHTTVPRIFAALKEQGLHLSEFRTHSATLEDVFVRLTGRNLRDE